MRKLVRFILALSFGWWVLAVVIVLVIFDEVLSYVCEEPRSIPSSSIIRCLKVLGKWLCFSNTPTP